MPFCLLPKYFFPHKYRNYLLSGDLWIKLNRAWHMFIAGKHSQWSFKTRLARSKLTISFNALFVFQQAASSRSTSTASWLTSSKLPKSAIRFPQAAASTRIRLVYPGCFFQPIINFTNKFVKCAKVSAWSKLRKRCCSVSETLLLKFYLIV